MAGAGANPADAEMQDLFALINAEIREDEKAQLVTIRDYWDSIKNQISFLSPNDLHSARDETEYNDQMAEMKRLMSAAVTNIDQVSRQYEQEENEETARTGNVLGGRWAPRITALKRPLTQKVRDYQNLLRARMAFIDNQRPAAGAAGGGGGGGQEFQVYQDPPVNAQNSVITKAKVKCKAVREDADSLSDELTETDILGWSLASDLEVGRAMRKMKAWRDQLERVKKQWREIDEIISTANIQDKPEEVTEAEETVQSLQNLFQEVKKQVEDEDLKRCLHSLEISTTAKVTLPSFEGRDDEDWTVFRERLEKALAANRVKTSDKCDKLRECLRGHAKTIVPSTQSDFEAAMNNLEKAFGDSSRLLNVKIASLKSLGILPKNRDNKSGKLVVEWYLKLESLLTSLLDLGCKTEDDDIRNTVFSKEIILTVAGLFPELYGVPIIQCGGSGEKRMRTVLNLIGEQRGKAQQWLQVQDNAGGRSQTDSSKPGGKSHYSNSQGSWNKKSVVTSLLSFKPPVKLTDCRICRALEEKGDTRQLYDDHHSNYPTGCPRFIAMSVEERREICIQAKFCLRCLDPKYKFAPNDRRHKCMDSRAKKSRYTCPKSDCRTHLWMCVRHRDDNTPELQKFKDEIKTRLGLRFCYFVGMLPRPVSSEEESDSESSSTTSESQSLPTDSTVPPPGPEPSSTSTQTSPKSLSSQNSQGSPRLSSEEAFKILKKKMEGKKIRANFRPIEPGAPQFMVGYSKGKTRPLVTLYDTGCLAVLFKEGVPDEELGPSVVKKNGPLFVNGVGDTTVKVNAEYMCSIQLVDGSRAVLEGVSVDNISSPLPYAKLTDAEKFIKHSEPGKSELQALRCNPEVGGDLDILMGIYYSALFPTPVHTLPSGLTIYKLVISSYDPLYTAVIGGPHESFAGMANYCGGFGPSFLSQLQNQLESFRKFGPPGISRALMSEEDYEFAARFSEISDETLHNLQDCNETRTENSFAEDPLEKSVLNVITDLLDISETVKNTSCLDCGESLNTALVSLNDDEDTRYLRMIQKAQEEGLNIEYRCPKCRNCNDCRNSHETERISLREEAEDLMIRDSVTLDWKNKIIISHLPMRGKPEEFLSDNRDNALKILQQQCLKYHSDEETKEIIVGAFNKLLKNGQMLLWENISQEDRDLILSKSVNHYIVWRVVFKASLSSPARIVFDASAKTKPRSDGSGGRCLNDLVVKGRVTTLDLVRMVLRFSVGQVALQGDLRQFYASIKLIKDNWNLQRVLFKLDLDPRSPPVEAVISTLIWGVKCVSAQSEKAVDKLAVSVKEFNPRLAELMTESRFVDDLGDSDSDLEKITKLIEDADAIFAGVGLSCKGWSVSGSDPPADVCEDGGSVSIAGLKWYPRVDCIEIPIPQLHFSKKSRGRLVIGTEVYDGHTLADIDKFVPTALTRRMVVSKKASLFDILGKLTPISARLSLDLRKVMRDTEDWNDAVSPMLRERWVENFFLLEQLRGIKFSRARLPEDAVSAEMDLIIAGDTAQECVKIAGVWARFKLKNGSFSNQHLIGRSLLGDDDSSIPKEELESLAMCSNLGWIVRQMLQKWVRDYIVISDSTISLCWVISEKKKLSLFHRNRSVQVRRGTDLDKLFHCRSEYNPCDLGTRTTSISVSDVGPQSTWELGLPWMTQSVEDAVKVGILKPAKDLILSQEESEDYHRGFVYEKSQEILTKGHIALHSKSSEKVQERKEFSNYVIDPLKFPFDKTVRVLSIVIRFIKSFKCLRGKLSSAGRKFQMLPARTEQKLLIFSCLAMTETKATTSDETVSDISRVIIAEKKCVAAVSVGVRDPGLKFHGNHHIFLTDDDISRALKYLFIKGSAEVKQFNKPDFIKKVAVETNEILYSKSRIMDGQRLQVAAGLEGMDFLSSFKPFRLGLNLVCPVLDRFSPLSIAIANYIHSEISGHRGFESSYRASLDFVFIIMGLSLFREIGEKCVKCLKLRTKYMEVSMGPLPDEAFVISPPFYICQVDIMGPLHIYVPGHSMALRNKKILEGKCYALVSVCMVTKCVNIQVIESKSADGVIDGITRLSCEVGVPKFIIVDKDTGIMKALTDCEVSMKDLQLYFFKEKGIQFRTVPVSGHNMTGMVERKIKSVQECLEKMDVEKLRLHATGYQTLFKLVENDLNNLPFGYCYGRKSDNSPIMQLLYPNLLRLGRNNSRSLDSVIKLPKTPSDLMNKIVKTYEGFYELWNTVMIPKMMKPSKWFSDNDVKIIPGDIVYFRKVENELNSKWTVGKVTDVTYGKDGKVRRATVEYQNANEDFGNKRTTERAVRSLVKLFHVDDKMWTAELGDVEQIIDTINNEEIDSGENESGNSQSFNSTSSDLQQLGQKLKLFVKEKSAGKPCKMCCCLSHCKLVENHGRSGKKLDVSTLLREEDRQPLEIMDRSWDLEDEYEEMFDYSIPTATSDVLGLIASVNVDLDDEPLQQTQWSTAL